MGESPTVLERVAPIFGYVALGVVLLVVALFIVALPGWLPLAMVFFLLTSITSPERKTKRPFAALAAACAAGFGARHIIWKSEIVDLISASEILLVAAAAFITTWVVYPLGMRWRFPFAKERPLAQNVAIFGISSVLLTTLGQYFNVLAHSWKFEGAWQWSREPIHPGWYVLEALAFSLAALSFVVTLACVAIYVRISSPKR